MTQIQLLPTYWQIIFAILHCIDFLIETHEL